MKPDKQEMKVELDFFIKNLKSNEYLYEQVSFRERGRGLNVQFLNQNWKFGSQHILIWAISQDFESLKTLRAEIGSAVDWRRLHFKVASKNLIVSQKVERLFFDEECKTRSTKMPLSLPIELGPML